MDTFVFFYLKYKTLHLIFLEIEKIAMKLADMGRLILNKAIMNKHLNYLPLYLGNFIILDISTNPWAYLIKFDHYSTSRS
jgi:hypothetical protein